MIKVSLKKDGHYLCTHVSRAPVPAAGPEHFQDAEAGGSSGCCGVSECQYALLLLTPERLFVPLWPAGAARLKRGSFTALLDSGVRLSHSVYGPTGGRTGAWQRTPSGRWTSRTESPLTPCALCRSSDVPGSRQ